MKQIKVENLGPIGTTDVEFGDLTILVGAQASGKSLFLETVKLAADKSAIIQNLKKYNYILGKNDQKNLLDVYYGAGLSRLWKDTTRITIDGKEENLDINPEQESDEKVEEKIFYIPAQRILSMQDGRPRAFSEFEPSSPYVLRQFSETLRIFMAGGFGGQNSVIFPIKTQLKQNLRDAFNNSIFHNGVVKMDTESMQRKIKLHVDGVDMPFMTWSAGQKEFMPLLMGFYCVSGSPTQVFNKEQYEYVVIEEPEMGLHPEAIKAIILQTIELVQSGYKVILSTHSNLPLDFVWAYNILKDSKKKGRELSLLRLFDKNAKTSTLFKGLFEKSIKTYYFARKGGKVNSVDISTLDVNDDNVDVNEWGGLSSFASQAADVVSDFCEL